MQVAHLPSLMSPGLERVMREGVMGPVEWLGVGGDAVGPQLLV